MVSKKQKVFIYPLLDKSCVYLMFNLSMERVIQEKISADHLLYVSLKYTKTCDVILNLITRWRSMIEIAMDRLLQKAKSKRLISSIPAAPKVKLEVLKKTFAKTSEIMETLNLYEFFKRAENAQKIRENEFRKNVNLKIFDKGDYVNVDLDKLKEYSQILERFISHLKQFL